MLPFSVVNKDYHSFISGAIESCIHNALSHSVSECQSDGSAELVIFFTKLVAVATTLEISEKRGPDRSSAPKTLSFSEKIAKIGSADPEITVLREIIKKR